MELSDESITATTFSSSLQQIHYRLHASEAVSRVHNVAWLNLPARSPRHLSVSVWVLSFAFCPGALIASHGPKTWTSGKLTANVLSCECAPMIPSGRTWSLIIGEAYLVKHCTVVDWQDDSVSVTSSPFHDLLYGFPLYLPWLRSCRVYLFADDNSLFFFLSKDYQHQTQYCIPIQGQRLLSTTSNATQVMICHCIRTF